MVYASVDEEISPLKKKQTQKLSEKEADGVTGAEEIR